MFNIAFWNLCLNLWVNPLSCIAYGKMFYIFFYNIAQRNIKKFSVLTLSYINMTLSKSAFRIYKCYIIMYSAVFYYTRMSNFCWLNINIYRRFFVLLFLVPNRSRRITREQSIISTDTTTTIIQRSYTRMPGKYTSIQYLWSYHFMIINGLAMASWLIYLQPMQGCGLYTPAM
jgi:hypothetical protein